MHRPTRDLGSVHRRVRHSIVPSLLVGMVATAFLIHGGQREAMSESSTASHAEVTSVGGSSRAREDTVLWFWSPGCEHCASEATALVEVAGRVDRDVRFVSVTGSSSEHDVRAFSQQTGLDTLEQLPDPAGAIRERYGVTEQPSYVLIDDDGSFEVLHGGLGRIGLSSVVAALIAT